MERTGSEADPNDKQDTAAASPGAPFWARHLRREIQYLIDLGVFVVAFLVALVLRFDRIEFEYLDQMPLVILVQIASLYIFGIYSFVWRYIGVGELKSFLKAAALSLIFLLGLRLGLSEEQQDWRVPISVIVLDTLLAFGGLLAIRVVRRVLYERYERETQVHPEDTDRQGLRTLLVGAGQAGVMAVRELVRQPRQKLEVVGFLDDDGRKLNSVIQGVRVLGTTRELAQVVEEHEVDRVILTMVRVPRETLRRLVLECQQQGVEVRIMPGLFDILEGRVTVFRKVQIEDVLGREAVRLDEDVLPHWMAGKRVMITGAGGSIGAELARQCVRLDPERVILVERSEPALFEIQQELLRLWPHSPVDSLVADAGDPERMRSILWDYRPQVVLHAAAHKHVPLMEQNPTEALQNNSLATYSLGRLVGELGVERFVLVSTDKAVRPTSIMGASKRLAEVFIQALDREFETRYVAVRFGNVLGSTGSVIPIFRRQIERGGPVTVTDAKMERYFMTTQEAAQLVLHTAVLGEGGEIFVLDMGEPVKIIDLARDMIRLAGYEPEVDIDIQITGRRPGEKIREELQMGPEELEITRHPKIFIGRLQPWQGPGAQEMAQVLEQCVGEADKAHLRQKLGELLPEARLDPIKTSEGQETSSGSFPTIAV